MARTEETADLLKIALETVPEPDLKELLNSLLSLFWKTVAQNLDESSWKKALLGTKKANVMA